MTPESLERLANRLKAIQVERDLRHAIEANRIVRLKALDSARTTDVIEMIKIVPRKQD